MLNSTTKSDEHQEKAPTVGERVSIGARKMAKAIAHDVWNKYDDEFGYRTEKQTSNDKVSVYDPDCLLYFFGQFDPHNQLEFVQELDKTTNHKFKLELFTWIQKYNFWYNLDKNKLPPEFAPELKAVEEAMIITDNALKVD